jgi:hypothetical protein
MLLLEDLKKKNLAQTKSLGKATYFILLSLLVLPIVLLIIDLDTFITPAILLLFVNFIFFMISLFRLALHASKNQEVRIKNSVDLLYRTYSKEGITVDSIKNADTSLLLVPSFSEDVTRLHLHTDKTSLYHIECFNKIGSEQKKTIYFRGLYLITKASTKREFQYHETKTLSQSVIKSFLSLYGTDLNDTSNYKVNKALLNGNFYSDDGLVPDYLEDLVKTLKGFDLTKALAIGQRQDKIHIAIETKHFSLPYVKHYKEEEVQKIKDTLQVYEDLIEKVEHI